SGQKPRVVTNVDQIAADPDLLRQWIHHKRAELVFRHALAGEDGWGALLEPEDRDEALIRAESLVKLSDSLTMLAPEEGAELVKMLDQRWRNLANTVSMRYEAPHKRRAIEESGNSEAEDEAGTAPEPALGETDLLKEEHVQTIADICLICM